MKEKTDVLNESISPHKKKNLHSGHRERLRERFLSEKAENIPDHVLLEMLLCYAIPVKDVNPTAHKLIDAFGSLSGVFAAGAEQLSAIDGIGKNAAVLLKLVPDIVKRASEKKSKNDDVVFSSFDKLSGYLIEYFHSYNSEQLILLSVKPDYKLSSIIPVAKAKSEDDCSALNRLLLAKKPYSVALAHNHISGCVSPSSEDLLFTQKARELCNVLGVVFIDHYIIGGGNCRALLGNTDYFKNAEIICKSRIFD